MNDIHPSEFANRRGEDRIVANVRGFSAPSTSRHAKDRKGLGAGPRYMDGQTSDLELLQTLEVCLVRLDELGLRLSAVHLDGAIQTLRREVARSGPDRDETPPPS